MLSLIKLRHKYSSGKQTTETETETEINKSAHKFVSVKTISHLSRKKLYKQSNKQIEEIKQTFQDENFFLY